jgi:hydrogenase maturation protease
VRRVLVAGVGNIFLGDDGFGVEVAARLAGAPVPDGVEVADFGIRGVHLAYQLLEGYDALVLVDAVRRGEDPGTLSLLEVETEGEDPPMVAVDAHGMDPHSVLATLAGLGGSVERVLVVACEVAHVDEGIGLSAPVSRAVPAAAELVLKVVGELCSENPAGPPDGPRR